MSYSVFFHSDLPETATWPLVRTLESLPLSVIRLSAAGKGPPGMQRRPDIPVVTLGGCPDSLDVIRGLGPRAWIAVLPAHKGSEARFTEAGAFAILRLPLERSALLSAVSRSISTFAGEDMRVPHIHRASVLHARNHALTG